MHRNTVLFILLGMLLMQVGCAHTHLRFNTNHQARSVADLHTQEVLDNLAKFAANPNSMPHFSYASASSSNVSDTIPLMQGFQFSPSRLASWSLNTGVTRGAMESYTTNPIRDPRKLELMRCAFQRATGSCCCAAGSSCANCEKLFNNFYLGQTTPSNVPKTTSDGRPIQFDEGLGIEVYREDDSDASPYRSVATNEVVEIVGPLDDVLVSRDIAYVTNESGETSILCVDGPCWFKVGSKRDVPKKFCQHVGQHCGTYVWVPACHTQKLTDLTLTILDIALNDPVELPPNPTMMLKVKLDQNGRPTNDEAITFYEVETEVERDTNLADLFPGFNVTQPKAVRVNMTREGIQQIAPAPPRSPSRAAPKPLPKRKRTSDPSRSIFDFRLGLDALAPSTP